LKQYHLLQSYQYHHPRGIGGIIVETIDWPSHSPYELVVPTRATDRLLISLPFFFLTNSLLKMIVVWVWMI
jgi:hypothetical protein